MIVAMITVRMMQMTIDEIIDVVAVRHGLVAAALAMDVSCIMATTAMIRSTPIRILVGHFNHVFIDMVPMGVVQVRVVEVIDVSAMANGEWRMAM